MAAVRAPLIAFLDQDDIWKPEKLEVQTKYLRAHPDVAAVSCVPDVVYHHIAPQFYIDLWVKSIEAAAKRGVGKVGLRDFLTVCPVFMSGAIVHAEAAVAVGPFDPDLPQTSDWLFWACLASRQPIGILDASLAQYRIHGGNQMIRLASEPFGLLRACFSVQDKLAEWIATDRAIPLSQAKKLVHDSADFTMLSQLAGTENPELLQTLLGNFNPGK